MTGTQRGNKSHFYLLRHDPAVVSSLRVEPPSLGHWSLLVINTGNNKANNAYANASQMIDRKTEKRLAQRHET